MPLRLATDARVRPKCHCALQQMFGCARNVIAPCNRCSGAPEMPLRLATDARACPKCRCALQQMRGCARNVIAPCNRCSGAPEMSLRLATDARVRPKCYCALQQMFGRARTRFTSVQQLFFSPILHFAVLNSHFETIRKVTHNRDCRHSFL